MSASPVDPARCPLCSGENACGMAAGAETCWCFDTSVPPEAIDRVPSEARDRACICRGCASQSQPVAAASAPLLADLVRRR